MKRTIILLFAAIILMSFVSADVIITEQPKNLYNLGDKIEIPIKITTTEVIQDSFKLTLICNGNENLVHFENIELSPGEEESMKPIILLNKNFIEKPGSCVAKAVLGSQDPILTNSFEVSDYIKIELEEHEIEVKPEERILIEGNAIKENGENVQGKVTLKIESDNKTIIEKVDSVKNGYFFLNFSFPKDTSAGQYLVKIDVHENDLENILTNKGATSYNLRVSQIPTSLEIVFDERPVIPGNDLKLKTILHDQTGESIEAISIVTIKNEKNKILDQIETETNTFFEFPIRYNQPPAEWSVVAVSTKLSAEENFNITEKEDIEISLVNRTLIIKNVGNVPYCNKPALVKIGNESLNIDICLDVDKEQKYILTAPEGEYTINFITEDTEEKLSGSVALTGKAVAVKESSKAGFLKSWVAWTFIIAILGFVAFMFFKKGYKKSFFGYITKKPFRKNNVEEKSHSSKDLLLIPRNKAELSLSIKGEKQNTSVVCLKIKDLEEKLSKKTGIEETIKKITHLSEENKSAVYENNDNLFFIFAPVKTKTFKNEKTAIKFAYNVKELLSHHNKLMKDKVEFGISVNYGTIVAKLDSSTLKFMSMGTLITTAKRIANLSKEEILLSEKINERILTDAKTQKHIHGNTTVYTIKEIKDKDAHSGFLKSFVKRLEHDKSSKEK